MLDKVAASLYELKRRYSKKPEPIKFDFRDFITSNLHIKRSNIYSHNIHSYPGRLYPYIPIYFLSSDKLCPSDGKILDPFSGGGTVLLESIVNPFFKRDAYGVEINPLGRLISKVKTTALNPKILDKRIEKLNSSIEKIGYSEYKEYIPSFKNIDFWFSRKAINGLSKIKVCINHLNNDDYKDFFWLCFSKLVRSISRADPTIPPPVLLKVEKYKDSYRYEQLKALMVRNEKPNVAAIFKQILRENTTRVKTLWDIAEIRTKKVKAEIIWDDARSIKKGSYTIKGLINKSHFEELNNSISCIITSPPYLAAQKYVRSTKLELFWLGMASDSDINKLDRDTIGHERISLRYNKHDFDITFVDTLLEKIENKSKERMLIVSEYLRNMVEVFRNCHKLLVNDGVMVIVVGNNKISNMTINTMKLLTILAKKCGFKDTLVLYDEIKGRGMITKRHYTGGLIKNEFLIVLRKSDNGT